MDVEHPRRLVRPGDLNRGLFGDALINEYRGTRDQTPPHRTQGQVPEAHFPLPHRQCLARPPLRENRQRELAHTKRTNLSRPRQQLRLQGELADTDERPLHVDATHTNTLPHKLQAGKQGPPEVNDLDIVAGSCGQLSGQIPNHPSENPEEQNTQRQDDQHAQQTSRNQQLLHQRASTRHVKTLEHRNWIQRRSCSTLHRNGPGRNHEFPAILTSGCLS